MNKKYKKLVSNMWRDLASDKKLARPSHNSTSVPESQLKKCAPVTTQKVCPVTTQKVCPSHNSKSVPCHNSKKCAPFTTQKVCPTHNSKSVPQSQLKKCAPLTTQPHLTDSVPAERADQSPSCISGLIRIYDRATPPIIFRLHCNATVKAGNSCCLTG